MVAIHGKTQKRSTRKRSSQANSGISPEQPKQHNAGCIPGDRPDKADNPTPSASAVSSETGKDDLPETTAVEHSGRRLKVSPDPRTVKGACVRIPSGARVYIEGVDPKDSNRVLVRYESGLGTDSYPLHLLTLVHESPEQANLRELVKGSIELLEHVQNPDSVETATPQWQRGDRFLHTQTHRIGTILDTRIEAKLNQEPERQLVVRLYPQDGQRGVRKAVWNLAEVEQWLVRLDDEAAIAPSPSSLIPSTPTEVVPADPQQRLIQLEADIQSGLDLVEQGKAQIWQAVAQIQADRLWKIQGYQSFEEYGKKRWGWEKANTYEVASAGRVVTELQQSGIPDSELPTSVSQTRELARLPAEKRSAALKQAAEVTGGKPTAKAIREAAQALEPSATPEDDGKDTRPGTRTYEEEVAEDENFDYPPICKPSITPEEFNREMAANSNQFSGCHSCTHQRLTGQGDRYWCTAGESEFPLQLKHNWFVMNGGCKSYSKPDGAIAGSSLQTTSNQEPEASNEAIAPFPQSLESDETPCYYKALFTSALREWARAKGRDLDVPSAMEVVLESLEAMR